LKKFARANAVPRKIFALISLTRFLHGFDDLARIFHESSAATADMAVLPGVLGCRTLRRTVHVRLRSNSLRFSGGTTLSTASRQQFMKYPGQICNTLELQGASIYFPCLIRAPGTTPAFTLTALGYALTSCGALSVRAFLDSLDLTRYTPSCDRLNPSKSRG
jgi:hypothetical protein